MGITASIIAFLKHYLPKEKVHKKPKSIIDMSPTGCCRRVSTRFGKMYTEAIPTFPTRTASCFVEAQTMPSPGYDEASLPAAWSMG